MRLIDADKITERVIIYRIGKHLTEPLVPFVLDLLRERPTVEAESVIRCKDCKHGKKSKENFDFDGTPLCDCSYMTQPNRWNEYCSWAESKRNGKKRTND